MSARGTANAGDAFDLRIVSSAAESAYAAVVRLVRAAQTDRAEFTRMADRYAAFFLPFTLAVAGLPGRVRRLGARAGGDGSRDPVPADPGCPDRVGAGLSRAARAGVIVKGGGAHGAARGARTVLLDKTGTLTLGDPEVERIVPLGSLTADEALRLAASVDQLSVHVLAEASSTAPPRGLELARPRR